jgi:protein-tyrosine phosphatase
LIELHFHCLPGIDDGPADWSEAVALCRAAADEGTGTIVATPHVLRDPWLNEDPKARDAQMSKLNALLGGRPAILPGCECWFTSDMLELLEKGDAGPLTTLNRGRYLLVEFPPGDVPSRAGAAFHELGLIGVTPVVAHAERNLAFARSPARLGDLVERGAMVQVTAASLLGELGLEVQKAAVGFFEAGMLHLVASDAHSLDFRPPRLAAARDWVRRSWGDEVEAALFDLNPKAVLASQPLPFMGPGPGSE